MLVAKYKILTKYFSLDVFKILDNWKFLVNDSLPWKIRPEDSTWSLFPGDHIHVNSLFVPLNL